MRAKPSLRRVLARQWIGFGLTLLAAFAAMALLLLFLLEDSFIDDRLRDVAHAVTRMDTPVPAGFFVHAAAAAPDELRVRMTDTRPGVVREFRLSDGRYVHALRGRTASGEPFLLVYDVSDQLRVNQALQRGWPWLLLMAVVLAAVAYALAAAFVGRISSQASLLVEQIGGSPDPTRLQALAQLQSIAEFSTLARLAADAWESRLASLERERETLAFLGHELRTPLQSARTSLELLATNRDDDAAWRRLRRAQDRLVRASHSVLWLATDTATDVVAHTDMDSLARSLAEEFAPLAAQRGQVIVRSGELGVSWELPQEVAEVVLANLLLNAIQHGGPGDVRVHMDASGMEVSNPPGGEAGAAGFGLGLTLCCRLLDRFGATLRLSITAERVVVVVELPDAGSVLAPALA